MDKGTGAIVGAPAENCIKCRHCTDIHEELKTLGNIPIMCGRCLEHNIEVWELDSCSDWEERKETDGE